MKPTRNIVKVNKGLWTPKHTVWFKKNDDSNLSANIKEDSKTNCPKCKKKKPFKYVGECPDCDTKDTLGIHRDFTTQ